MSPTPRPNRVGIVSLSIAAGGFIALEVANHWHLIEGTSWSVVRAGFEAAVVGGVADWFAVSALFKPVPGGRLALPHTDIIVRNRHKLTDGVVDLVENQLLSPSSVREKLRGFSLSKVLFEQFDSRDGRQLAASTLSVLAGHAAAELEDAKLRGFLTQLLREQIRTAKLAPLFASWIEARVAAGDTRVLWQTVAATLADQAERGDFDELLREIVQSGLDAYKGELSGLAKVKGWIASAAFDAETDGRRLRVGLSKTLRDMAIDASHPFAARLDKAVLAYAANLHVGDNEAAERVRDFQERLATHPDLEDVVGHMLTDLRRLAETKLRDSRGEFETALADLIERGLTKLRGDEEAKARLDHWARESLGSIVTRHHGVIGTTARESLNRLDDRDLVAQLEMKVGSDLQYIRLNGAVIGGLVGVVLMATKLLLGST
ncbi:MAG: DUF445 domain-containing protein [Verrucomicrobia bacterium]|nr:DUF445 domain-containing protein [Verrucomicrobiota bacterium]